MIRGFIQDLKVVILAYYFHKIHKTSRSTNVQKIDINNYLNQGLKIEEGVVMS